MGESTARLISFDSLPTQISFQGASALTDIPYMNTSGLTTMTNMFNGKYYIQNDILYLCTRDSGIAIQHDLASLIGIYVEVYQGE